jgi:capping protein alpha
LILSKLAVDADTGKIVHPKSQQLFEVDHANMKVVGEPQPMAGPMDPELEEARSALEAAMEQYVDAQYQEDTAASAVYAVNGELRVVVSGEKLNLRNFWSGLFVSTWTVKPASLAVAGEIKVRAHYFEDGNVQLQTKKAVAEASVSGDLASAVRDFIAGEEKTLQEGLELMYANMTDETFKAMRRVMPVHRNKMTWNINEVKSRMQLGKK